MANEVAKNIVEQLGNVSLSMIGAYQLVALPDGLQFGIRGSRRVAKIVIKLDAGTDTYTSASTRARGCRWRRLARRTRGCMSTRCTS